jgi:hypothetical protein
MHQTFGAYAKSFRVGHVRLDEVLPQVSNSDEVHVQVLDAAGHLNFLTLKYARKWGATSWRREFRCQRCSGPARTLQLLDGLCLCRKCAPLPTQHHIHKNATAWANEDGLADAIIRLTLKQPTNARRHRKRRLVARLTENTLANASNVLTNVQALIVAVDSLPEWVGTTR